MISNKEKPPNLDFESNANSLEVVERAKKFEQFENVLKQAKEVVELLKQEKLFITTVESCTGGGLAYFLTNISGASEVMRGGLVTYSNDEKMIYGIPKETIDKFTVYSNEVAEAMAQAGIQASSKADIGVGITGSISRVDPLNPNSKPGEVYVAVISGNEILSKKFIFTDAGERYEIKNLAISEALKIIKKMINKIKKIE